MAFAATPLKSALGADELTLVRAPSFALLENAAGAASAACAPEVVATSVLRDLVERADELAGVDPQIAILFFTEPLGCQDLFYVPVANDVRGIGYAHVGGRDTFDDSPTSALEGVAFLNDFPYWAAHPEELTRAFEHEVAHRWSGRVEVKAAELEPNALLGRQSTHWSYFLDTGGSPLEGNRWTSPAPGRWVADSPFQPSPFADLDLYLMGVLPPEEVAPLTLLRPAPTTAHDCLGGELTSSSPPQVCGPLELAAEDVEVSLDSVIAVEGERQPAAGTEPRSVDAAVFVVATGNQPPTSADCTALGTALTASFADFESASRGRLTLRNLTTSDETCDAWPARATRLAAPSGCTASRARRAPRVGAGACLGVAALLLGLRRRSVRLLRAARLN